MEELSSIIHLIADCFVPPCCPRWTTNQHPLRSSERHSRGTTVAASPKQHAVDGNILESVDLFTILG